MKNSFRSVQVRTFLKGATNSTKNLYNKASIGREVYNTLWHYHRQTHTLWNFHEKIHNTPEVDNVGELFFKIQVSYGYRGFIRKGVI